MTEATRFVELPAFENVVSVDVGREDRQIVFACATGERVVGWLPDPGAAPEVVPPCRLRECRLIRRAPGGNALIASRSTGFWRVWREQELLARPLWVPPGLWLRTVESEPLAVLSGSVCAITEVADYRPIFELPGAQKVPPWGEVAVLAALLPDREHMIVVEPAGAVWKLHMPSKARTPACDRPSEVANALDLSPDGAWFAIAGLLGRGLGIWSASTGERHRALDGLDSSNIVTLRFSPDGRRIALGAAAGSVEVIDLASAQSVVIAPLGGLRVQDLAWRSETELIAATGQAGLWWIDVPASGS